MREPEDYESLLAALERVLAFIETQSFPQELPAEPPPESIRAAVVAAVVAAREIISELASNGECRKDVPYSPLHPVLDASGNFMWCCNHETEHCGR